MTDEEVLSELRIIRTLLALDKEDELNGVLSDLGEIQNHVLEQLDEEWASVGTSEIADEFDVSNSTVRRAVGDLLDRNLVEKRGDAGGTEYRKTGLLRAAELSSSN